MAFTTQSTAVAPRMTTPLTFAMALATGVAVANIYYNQPMLKIMAHEFPGAASLVSPVTQLGYAAGLFLLVPLGDIVERKRLIVAQFAVLAIALLALAFASGTATVLIASVFVGFTATVAQQIIPFAAHLASPDRRGATVGTLMSGLLGGILLSRTVAGYIGGGLGWREMYMIAVPVAILGAIGMWAVLPSAAPSSQLRYPALLASIRTLWKELPELRRAAFTQALLFAGFSAFWTVLPFRLAEPQFGMGAGMAGLFGIVGAVGVIAAPLAGKISDRRGPAIVVKLGAIICLLSWVLFAASPTITALVIGVITLDFGTQSAMVSNQSIVYSLRPEARARLNTVFMGSMFLGGAAGSAIGMAAYNHSGWTAATLVACAASAVAVGLQLSRRAPE